MKQAVKPLSGIVLPALYELLLDGSGVGTRQRWHKLKGWASK